MPCCEGLGLTVRETLIDRYRIEGHFLHAHESCGTVFGHCQSTGRVVAAVRFIANGGRGLPAPENTEQFVTRGTQWPPRLGSQLRSGGQPRAVERTALKVCSQPAAPSGTYLQGGHKDIVSCHT
jgi:hypothetical protein